MLMLLRSQNNYVPGSSVSAAGEGRSQDGVTSAFEPTEFVPEMFAPVPLVSYNDGGDAESTEETGWFGDNNSNEKTVTDAVTGVGSNTPKSGEIPINFVAVLVLYLNELLLGDGDRGNERGGSELLL